jgi:hypothetical protein
MMTTPIRRSAIRYQMPDALVGMRRLRQDGHDEADDVALDAANAPDPRSENAGSSAVDHGPNERATALTVLHVSNHA